MNNVSRDKMDISFHTISYDFIRCCHNLSIKTESASTKGRFILLTDHSSVVDIFYCVNNVGQDFHSRNSVFVPQYFHSGFKHSQSGLCSRYLPISAEL